MLRVCEMIECIWEWVHEKLVYNNRVKGIKGIKETKGIKGTEGIKGIHDT